MIGDAAKSVRQEKVAALHPAMRREGIEPHAEVEVGADASAPERPREREAVGHAALCCRHIGTRRSVTARGEGCIVIRRLPVNPRRISGANQACAGDRRREAPPSKTDPRAKAKKERKSHG